MHKKNQLLPIELMERPNNLQTKNIQQIDNL